MPNISSKVINLIQEFYSKNFRKAGIKSKLEDEIAQFAAEGNFVEMKKIFKPAEKEAIYPIDESDPKELLDLSSAKSFLDIGANQLGTLNYVAEKYPQIEKLTAIDVIPQRRPFFKPEKSTYIQQDASADIKIPDKSIDVINLQFMLHHIINNDSIEKLLGNCERILSQKGRLIIWEETFREEGFLEDNINKTRSLGFKGDLELTKKFYNLTIDERFQFIEVNDRIINSSNKHMQWNNNYKIWEIWVKILKEHKFELEQEFELGLRISGRLKHGVHMIGVFKIK